MQAEITRTEQEQIAVGDGLSLTVRGGRLFHRKAIKMDAQGNETRRLSMLVGELDGVRLYVCDEGRMVLTREDLKL